jgi:diaminohydroxyphosphoribosylaminopyrimidine deaminase/5-amino-6-(5-phosphoribosylamino)uracil reductase
VDARRRDERFMRMAIAEARKGEGRTSPNPTVGAVLAVDDKVLARTYHERAGEPHAEVRCLSAVSGRVPRHATLYVTMEPCSSIGKTGRCTDAIIDAGVSSVVIGTIDPNPQHNGRGIKALQRAGVSVRAGILHDDCAKLNEAFNKWIVSRMPLVIVKCGMSLDGRLTRLPGEGPWITSTAARRDGRLLRSRVDAVLVGAETIRADNPRLTVRGGRSKAQPWRVILTRSGKLPTDHHVFNDRNKSRTVIYRSQPLKAVLRDLGKKKILSVLIEGGGEVLGQALDSRLIDKVQVYIGPLFSGGPTLAFSGRGASSTQSALRLERISYRKFGDDIRVTGYPTTLSAKGEPE